MCGRPATKCARELYTGLRFQPSVESFPFTDLGGGGGDVASTPFRTFLCALSIRSDAILADVAR
jgi:hypothetical protein